MTINYTPDFQYHSVQTEIFKEKKNGLRFPKNSS